MKGEIKMNNIIGRTPHRLHWQIKPTPTHALLKRRPESAVELKKLVIALLGKSTTVADGETKTPSAYGREAKFKAVLAKKRAQDTKTKSLDIVTFQMLSPWRKIHLDPNGEYTFMYLYSWNKWKMFQPLNFF